MNVVWLTLLLIAIVVALSIYKSNESQAAREQLEAMAAKLGLDDVTRSGRLKVFKGELDGREVRIGRISLGESVYTRIFVAAPVPAGLFVASPSKPWRPNGPQETRSMSLGVDDFDAAFAIDAADEAVAVAHLDADVRTALLKLSDYAHVALEGAGLEVTTGRQVPQSDAVDRALAAARALETDPGGVGARLERAAFEDPAPAVRIAALRHALARAGAEDRRRLLGRALVSTDPGAMLLAARELGRAPESSAALWLAVESEECEDRTLIEALELLEAHDELASKPLQLFALSRRPSSDVRAAAARALGAVGGVKAIHRLLDLLREEDDWVAAAAARALGACASRSEVAALEARASGLLKSGRVRSAVGEAIAAIHARASRGAGKLSLTDEVDTARGALSVARDRGAAGALTQVEAEADAGA